MEEDKQKKRPKMLPDSRHCGFQSTLQILSALLVLVTIQYSRVRLPTMTIQQKSQARNFSAAVQFWDEDSRGDLRPRNLHIAFIGDSLTRFQYISLVHFLKMGNWTNDAKLMDSHLAANWSEWINYPTSLLHPDEHCDCYRGGKWNASEGSWWDMTNENRYYRDDRGNHITMLVKFGRAPINGHWAPEEVYDGPMSLENWFIPYQYRYNWSEAIRQLLGRMKPRPDFVVINAGLHPHDLDQDAVQHSIVEALNETGMIGIYKTTTFVKSEQYAGKRQFGHHDQIMCEMVGHCLNLSWTGLVPKKHYNPKDRLHFNSKVNTLMNKQLLHYLRYELDLLGDRPPQPVNITTLL